MTLPASSNQPLFLGIDLSTQQLKAIAVDADLTVTHEFAIPFDAHFAAEFKIKDGVQVSATEADVVTVPTLMWVAALDALLASMRSQAFPFHRVKCISGTGQQHGSVYWAKGAESTLAGLESSSNRELRDILSQSFAVQDSPIWMDSSTAAECAVLEQAVGGPEKLAAISGSRAYERFTGAQIAKLQRTKPDQMAACERISLVSSFVASLLIGGYAPIDESDGSGMNLLNLQTRNWEARLLQATQVSDLSVKLGAPVPSDTLVGTISRYFVSRYGFAEDCVVGAFTGDNPASLAGMRIGEGDMTVSLGTSDTLFLWLKDTQSLQQERTTLDGHVFCNPVDTQSYMALLCYKNGSLARERVRDRALHLNSEQTQTQKWAAFDAALASTPVGNNGIVAAYFDQTEITPSARGELRLGADGNEVAALSPEQEIRSLIEGQFLAKRLHAERLGYNTSSARRILATGGASNNGAILQILANVFGARVYRLEQANSAALGCAFRAVHSWRKHGSLHDARSFEQATAQAEPPKLVAVPDPAATAVYNQLLQAYANVESLLVARTKRDA